MTDSARIEQLREEIARKRSELAGQRAELHKLQRELEAFARQYDQVIGPLEAQLDSLRQQIEAYRATPKTFHPLWGEFGSFEESFDAKYRQKPEPGRKSVRKILDEESIRSLYRKLVRRFHPDTTTDPAEKKRLTVIMAQVNAAYRAKDSDTLYALDGRRAPQPGPLKAAPAPPRPLLQDLLETHHRLDDELTDVKIEYQNLLNGPLMQLKIEQSLARARGGNLLREITLRVRAEIQAAQSELAALRKQF